MSYKPKFNIYPSSNILFSNLLNKLWRLNQICLRKNKILNISLSGGNTPVALYKYIALNYRTGFDWKNINFYWGDERCVAPENELSNYGNAKKYLFDKLSIPKKNIFRIVGESNPASEVLRYSKEIIRNVPFENNFPKFDLVLLGIGEDGHTASIFPKDIELIKSKNICEFVTAPDSDLKRITLTGNVIKNAEFIYFLVTGESKSKIISEIFNKSIIAQDYPAYHINSTRGRTEWYLDADAAGMIKSDL